MFAKSFKLSTLFLFVFIVLSKRQLIYWFQLSNEDLITNNAESEFNSLHFEFRMKCKFYKSFSVTAK